MLSIDASSSESSLRAVVSSIVQRNTGMDIYCICVDDYNEGSKKMHMRQHVELVFAAIALGVSASITRM